MKRRCMTFIRRGDSTGSHPEVNRVMQVKWKR